MKVMKNNNARFLRLMHATISALMSAKAPVKVYVLASMLAMAVISSRPALALDCENATTTVEINECAYADYQKADEELNATYQALREQLNETGKFLLRDAQRTWISFRDAECQRITDPYRDGSYQRVAYNACLTDQTLKRSQQLRDNPGTGEQASGD